MNELTTIDLGFNDAPEVIASFVAPTGDGGCVAIESGPASSAERFVAGLGEAGFAVEDLRALCLTHVHLDHAGGAGTIARRADCPVYAHPRGIEHLVEPGRKLLPSAERLYGDQMERLWGRTVGVPAELARPIGDGESIVLDGLELRAWHTPGHASHHVAWQLGTAVASGDVGGVRFPGSSHVLPPAPPPDLDLEAWRVSIDRLRALGPERLLLTHFGEFADVVRHLDELEGRLERWERVAREVLAAGGDRASLASALAELDRAEMADAEVTPSAVARYQRLCPMGPAAAGLARYLARR